MRARKASGAARSSCACTARRWRVTDAGVPPAGRSRHWARARARARSATARGQPDPHVGAAARTVLNSRRAAVRLRDRAHDRQAEAGALLRAGARGAGEALEGLVRGEARRGDGAVVLDVQGDVPVLAVPGAHDLAGAVGPSVLPDLPDGLLEA